MLRIAVDDSVDRVTVVRGEGLTLILRPTLIDRDVSATDTVALLLPRELAVLRAALGIRAGEPCTAAARVAEAVSKVSCPCFIPHALRSPLDVVACPLHADLTAVLA